MISAARRICLSSMRVSGKKGRSSSRWTEVLPWRVRAEYRQWGGSAGEIGDPIFVEAEIAQPWLDDRRVLPASNAAVIATARVWDVSGTCGRICSSIRDESPLGEVPKVVRDSKSAFRAKTASSCFSVDVEWEQVSQARRFGAHVRLSCRVGRVACSQCGRGSAGSIVSL